MRRFTAVLLLVLSAADPAATQIAGSATPTRIRGRAVDARTGQPVTHAVVHIAGASADADSAGFFSVTPTAGATLVHVTALGYRATALPWPAAAPLIVRLQPQALRVADTVVIAGHAPTDGITVHDDRRRASTTAALAHVAGVAMVGRGAFGQEPTLRGMQGGRVGVLIDGMHVMPACVDRMDPVTAYVDVENLERLEVTKGAFDLTGAQGLAGTLDLVTRGADPGRAPGWTLQSGYESAAARRVLRAEAHGGVGPTAARASVALQRSGNLTAGGDDDVPGSGYSKVNAKVDVMRRLGDGHALQLGALADRAWDVGYPALLMDARRAHSLLLSAAHTWRGTGPEAAILRSRLYHSRVDHWMDDDERDVSRRPVMRDMHMPMYGNTRTWGWRQELETRRGARDVDVVLDAWRLAAFADMWMHSTQPGVAPMYLVNLGDVRSHHLALAGALRQRLTGALDLRVDLRVDGVASDLTGDRGRRQVEGSVSPGALARRDVTASGGAVLSWQVAQRTGLRLGLARAARLPTHIERYGFYMYDVGEGVFLQGNPELSAEHGVQLELGADHRGERLGLSVSLHHQRVTDYIAGSLDEPLFKSYANLSAVDVSGVEVQAVWRLTEAAQLRSTTAWTRGQNRDAGEPLPYIAPLGGAVELAVTRSRNRLELATRWSTAQRRVAARTTLEDETEGWAVLDLRGECDLGGGIQLQAGVDNVFDGRYHEHLSIGNLPAPGRSLVVSLRYER